MNKPLHGRLHGKTIELDEDIGAAEGVEVEVQVKILSEVPSEHAQRIEGLAQIYEILGERYDSGFTDLAERHNEHQP